MGLIHPRAAAVLAVAATLVACGEQPGTTVDPAPTVTVTQTEPAPAVASSDPVPSVEVDPCDRLPADADQLAFVFVSTPRPAQVVTSPISLTGCANTFEATYQWRLLDREGAVLAEGFGTATCGTGCVGTFANDVEYAVTSQQVGSLEVFTTSARDGAVEDLNVIPLVLQP